METSPIQPQKPLQPNPETIKRKLLNKGVFPTPKIIHTLRKKETQKILRKSNRLSEKTLEKPLSQSQIQSMEEETRFRNLSREYKLVMKEFKRKDEILIAGKPWERAKSVDLRELASGSKEYGGEKLKSEHLEELKGMFKERNGEDFRWLLDDDLEGDCKEFEREKGFSWRRDMQDEDAIRLLINRLKTTSLSLQDWKFSKLMNQSGIHYTENNLLRLVEGLGALGDWRHAMSVVEWVYREKDYKHYKSRFVYTKLLAILGKARRPSEALDIFNMMREDCQIYPDMPAYRSIAVTLGQAGLVKELFKIIECMRQKPSKRIKNMRRKNWDPCLEPDVVIFNAVLNACVPSQQWKGVPWVLEQMRRNGLKPTGATYGLAMEVMLKSRKYDLVHEYFEKMRRSGLPPKALTYKVLVRTYWEEGKVNDAVEAVVNMEQIGVVGTASVYYELACCLCYYGRWQEAMVQVEKIKMLPRSKPLDVTFTGMIQSCMDGGHLYHCISLFERMKDHYTPNIGTINAMLKVFGRNDMFAQAKQLFEETKKTDSGFQNHLGDCVSVTPDAHSYGSVLEAAARAHQWEYFEYVYKEMALCGYQLDQKKHAWVLVQASRAGKCHLLEHAFDTILEAEEIPHLSLFTEMICQNLARHNYERTIPLINGMAHASLKVSEKQWTDLFSCNQDRISKDVLQSFLDVLHTGDIMTESTLSNLLKSLGYICGSGSFNSSIGVIALGDGAVEESTFTSDERDVNSETGRNMQSHFIDVADGNFSPIKSPYDDGNIRSDVSTVNDTDVSDNEDGSGLVSNSPVSYLGDRDQSTGLRGYVEKAFDNRMRNMSSACVDDDDSDSIPDSLLQNDVAEITLDLLTRHEQDSNGPEVPSASEILEAWGRKRTEDGFFSF